MRGGHGDGGGPRSEASRQDSGDRGPAQQCSPHECHWMHLPSLASRGSARNA